MKNINQFRFLSLTAILVGSIIILWNMPINLGLDLQGGIRLVLEGRSTEKVKVSDDAMAGVVAVIRNRIDALGVSEPIIQRKGRSQVVVELPGEKNPDRAVKLIGDTALLEFVEAEWPAQSAGELTQEKIRSTYGGNARLGSVISGRKDGGSAEKRETPIILKQAVLKGSDLKWAGPGLDQYGNPVVDIEFTADGAKIFASVTANNVGRPLAILLDGKVISAPNVREPIAGGRAQISGDFSIEEVQDLVIKLKAGALPIPVEIVESQMVGPTLGKDSIDKSKIAGIIGFIIVAGFMIFYYRLPGFLADIALVLYLFIVLGALALLKATLTLPGIAGFLLSIGMAVDANVIIFERLKEELRDGKTLKSAIDASFNRAFSAILDSNVTTIIAAATLFWLGTGTIKGFAITLSLGILASMFSAIVITRMLLYIVVDAKILTDAKSKLLYK